MTTETNGRRDGIETGPMVGDWDTYGILLGGLPMVWMVGDRVGDGMPMGFNGGDSWTPMNGMMNAGMLKIGTLKKFFMKKFFVGQNFES